MAGGGVRAAVEVAGEEEILPRSPSLLRLPGAGLRGRPPLPADGCGDAAAAEAPPAPRILLVYGLLGEVISALHPLGFDYMHPLRDWLVAQGADVAVVPLRTAEPIAANAARLREVLLADPRPALVIAHSKGGLEALAALLEPEAQARCAGFLAMQSPFYGSPVADAVMGAKPFDAAARSLARLLRIGSGEGVKDLTTGARRLWMAAAAERIARLVRSVPVVCLATTLTGAEAHGRENLHLAAARWMEKRGDGPNDGLVPVASALIPGARHLVLPGSHIATVSRGPGRNPVAMLQAGLAELARV